MGTLRRVFFGSGLALVPLVAGIVLGVLVAGTAFAATTDDGDAKSIVASYGRSNGLCAVLSASKEIPAALVLGLAEQGLAVHVIATEESARAQLTSALGTSTPSNSVMVERLAMPPLPYFDNSVNLVVIEDAGAIDKKGKDVKEQIEKEILRVVTPGGTIAVRKSSGKLEFTKKAWPAGMSEWTHPNGDAMDNRCPRRRG